MLWIFLSSNFLISLFSIQIPHIQSKSILTFGDSADRDILSFWCTHQSSQATTEKFIDFRLPNVKRDNRLECGQKPVYNVGYYCNTSQHSLAHVHIYGSHKRGPYLDGLSQDRCDGVVNDIDHTAKN